MMLPSQPSRRRTQTGIRWSLTGRPSDQRPAQPCALGAAQAVLAADVVKAPRIPGGHQHAEVEGAVVGVAPVGHAGLRVVPTHAGGLADEHLAEELPVLGHGHEVQGPLELGWSGAAPFLVEGGAARPADPGRSGRRGRCSAPSCTHLHQRSSWCAHAGPRTRPAARRPGQRGHRGLVIDHGRPGAANVQSDGEAPALHGAHSNGES
jgi:hypothetical protein